LLKNGMGMMDAAAVAGDPRQAPSRCISQFGLKL
jgi:hypothetical protein